MAPKPIWLHKPPNSSKSKVSDATKTLVSNKAATFVDEAIKPNYIVKPDPDSKFNYLADVFCKWRGRYFYFYAKYNCPDPRAISPTFEIKYARMEYAGDDTFNIAFMRHTGKWQELGCDQSMDECFHEIANNPLFTP